MLKINLVKEVVKYLSERPRKVGSQTFWNIVTCDNHFKGDRRTRLRRDVLGLRRLDGKETISSANQWRNKDLSDFDKSQIVTGKVTGSEYLKPQRLVGCSRSAVVRIYQ